MVQLTVYRCGVCGDFVPAGRCDKIYCSDKCKMVSYRWRTKLPRYLSQAKQKLSDASAYIQYPQTRDLAISELKDIKKFVDELFAQYGVRNVR